MKNLIYIVLFIPLVLSSQYYTGQKVFKSKFPPEIKDSSQDTYIEIINSNTDIIVAVRNVRSDRVIQHAYIKARQSYNCLLYTSPSPRDRTRSRMPSSA